MLPSPSLFIVLIVMFAIISFWCISFIIQANLECPLTKISHSEPKFLLGHSYSIWLVGFETFQGHLWEVSLRKNIDNSSNNSHASIIATSLWTFCKLHALNSKWSIKLSCSFVLYSMSHLLLISPLHSKEHCLRCKHSWVFFEPIMTYVTYILASWTPLKLIGHVSYRVGRSGENKD
jgi:hypothetical protein